VRISNLRLLDGPPSPNGFRPVATFSLDISDDIRLFDFKMVVAPSGRHLIYPPRTGSCDVAAISPAVRNAIADLVVEKMETSHSDINNRYRVAA
jgi:hypothetical protein